MKYGVWMLLLLCCARVQAQLLVTYDKTVNVVFPYAIVSEDHGSSGIIVQQRKGASHILHVKANQKDFSPTSLSVVTSDGSLYSFVVQYKADVEQLNYIVGAEQAVASTEVMHNEKILQQEAALTGALNDNLHKRVSNDISILRLRGMYMSEHALWIKLTFCNRTAVPFSVGFIKFFIRDKQRAKNSAVQERELFPVYQEAPEVFEGKCAAPLLFAFDPFVVNRRQQLVMQVGELHGNRFIQLRVKPKHFRKTVTISKN